METTTLDFKLLAEEASNWKKTLVILEQQNIVQKNRLAAAMKIQNEKQQILLEQAEHYQYCFLQQDDTVRLMRNEIAVFEKSIASGKDYQCKELQAREKKLQAEIQSLKSNFNKLNREFAVFLLSFSPFYF